MWDCLSFYDLKNPHRAQIVHLVEEQLYNVLLTNQDNNQKIKWFLIKDEVIFHTYFYGQKNDCGEVNLG